MQQNYDLNKMLVNAKTATIHTKTQKLATLLMTKIQIKIII